MAQTNLGNLKHWLNERALSFYPVFDSTLLTRTIFTRLPNSLSESILKIHSVETVSEVSQESNMKIVTFVTTNVIKR